MAEAGSVGTDVVLEVVTLEPELVTGETAGTCDLVTSGPTFFATDVAGVVVEAALAAALVTTFVTALVVLEEVVVVCFASVLATTGAEDADFVTCVAALLTNDVVEVAGCAALAATGAEDADVVTCVAALVAADVVAASEVRGWVSDKAEATAPKKRTSRSAPTPTRTIRRSHRSTDLASTNATTTPTRRH